MSYEKTENLLDLAIWMQSSREGVSLSDIMARFNVSRRTAERMRDLIVYKFPQTEETTDSPDRKKRWYIPQGTLKDIVQFSADDLSCLELAKEALAKSHLPDKSQQLERIIDKIKTCIKPQLYRRLEPDAEELTRAEGIACRPGPKIQINSEIMELLRTAILSCQRVKIRYYNKSSKKTSVNVLDPYGFLYGERNHYLVARHADGYYGENAHNFILINIRSVEILEEPFVFPENFSLKEYAERSFGVFQEEPVEVEWLFDKEAAVEAQHYIFHPTQSMQHNPDGTLTVKFKAGGRLEMDWHLYTWGKGVKVIKPAPKNND